MEKERNPTQGPTGDSLGIYIHIPFCRSRCDYCDFYSVAGREDRMDSYQKALLAHIKETAPLAQGIPVDTVYFGGGTPASLGISGCGNCWEPFKSSSSLPRTRKSLWRPIRTAWMSGPCAASARQASTDFP